MNNKGFTLAELLIVVAIIAVLVAIAIPVFSAQLEKAREATDIANIRAAYAEVVAKSLDSSGSDHSYTVAKKQQQSNWQTTTTGNTIAGVALSAVNAKTSTKITYHKASGSTAAYVSIDGATVPSIEVN